VQVPKITSRIVAYSVGITKNLFHGIGHKVQDVYTICDSWAFESPTIWRQWLETGKFDITDIPDEYKGPMKVQNFKQFANLLREHRREEVSSASD
jgi:hypothetical protein